MNAAAPRSERAKLLAGELYDPADAELREARDRARSLCNRFNHAEALAVERQRQLLAQLFGRAVDTTITAPFHRDYGSHIELGEQVCLNTGCVVLDVAPVVIGSHTRFGPGVQIYAASRPL